MDRAGYADSKKKPVIVTDSKGVETEYPSQTDAANALNTAPATISGLCNGHLKSWHGYTVRFKQQSRIEDIEGVDQCL